MNTQLVIFDLDGTILDTLLDLADAVNHALSTYKLPTHTVEEIRSYIGNGIRNLIDRSVPEGTEEEIVKAVFMEFKSYYAAHCADKTCPYGGIPEMLDVLRNAGIKTTVLSNKADFAVQELCRKYFPGQIDYAAGEKEGIPKKPAPDSVCLLMQTMGCDAAHTLYVGDSEVDIETARNAGLECVIVDWGFRGRDQLEKAGATRICSTVQELTDALME